MKNWLPAVVVAFVLGVRASAVVSHGGVSHVIVKAGSAQIEVLEQGEGPAVVLLPSLGRGAEDFDAISADLAKNGFRVLRPQPRGIAKSHGPMDGLTMHDLAADVAAVIEHENAAPAIVLGHAFGNFVARQLAADRPDLVCGVVLAAASAGKVPAGSKELPVSPELRRAIDGSGDTSLPRETRIKYLQEAFFAPGHDPSVWLDGWTRSTHEMQTLARDHTPIDDYFAAGNAPILYIQPGSDPVAPLRFAGVLKDMLGDRVEMIEIPGASHALIVEQPEAVSAAVVAFANRQFPRAKPSH